MSTMKQLLLVDRHRGDISYEGPHLFNAVLVLCTQRDDLSRHGSTLDDDENLVAEGCDGL